jgi:hypothetical protein
MGPIGFPLALTDQIDQLLFVSGHPRFCRAAMVLPQLNGAFRKMPESMVCHIMYHIIHIVYHQTWRLAVFFSCPEIHSRSYNLDILGPCDSYGTSLVVSQVSCTTGAVFCWNTCQFQAPGRCWKGNNTHIPLRKKTHANPASPRGSRPYAPALHISQRNGHSRSSSPPIRPQIPHLKSAVQQDIELYGNRKRNATYFQVVVL